MAQDDQKAGRRHRALTAQERVQFEALRTKLAPGGEYAVKAAKRVAAREARSAAIIKLIDGKA
ncbi:hypothetical protein KIN34_14445 [Cellulomonas sp. DKR-3]|uniref:Uncharacterized protein n=1 Tax=Cellulomonas fulva TaxID=2835530 RepID=A0ABS5U258_9CELL|nr:hypothetical protein [Cellulomonas fulva]MBT0995483.1 hypothetical protein [Cellulomonas fulva]